MVDEMESKKGQIEPNIGKLLKIQNLTFGGDLDQSGSHFSPVKI